MSSGIGGVRRRFTSSPCPTPRAELRAISQAVSYAWGMIPVRVRIGQTDWETALFPKDGRYVVPVKDIVREAEDLALGDRPAVELTVSL